MSRAVTSLAFEPVHRLRIAARANAVARGTRYLLRVLRPHGVACLTITVID